MKKKKKLKKNFYVIIVIFTLIILIFLIKPYLNNKQSKTNNKTINNSIKKETYNDKLKKKCKELDYCKTEYINRYVEYHKKNPDLNMDKVILYVNCNLDYTFYNHKIDSPYLNTSYVLVNKYYYLGSDYIPDNLEDIDTNYARSGMKLVSEAKIAFEEMAKAAKDDGFPVIAMSSYRSYVYQVNLYNNYVKSDGEEAADTYSARPGYSEHQSGLCVDVYDGKIDFSKFEESKSFKWMKDNSYKYGFILRFPKGKENITGYQYESWHYRYVGKKIAKYIHENDITFEEYYAMFIEDKM